MSNSQTLVAMRADLVDEARKLDIDPAAVADRALFHKVNECRSEEEKARLSRQFTEDNAEAFAWANQYFEENGFPFPQYRSF